MAKVAEGMARVASEIATGRRERSKLSAEIKLSTKHRRGDVESFLKDARSARDEATREQAGHRRQTTKARHTDVFSMLVDVGTSRRRAGSLQAAEAKTMTRELHSEMNSMLAGRKASRIRAARDNRKEAVDTSNRRQSQVRAMLDQFAVEGVARQQHRHELAGAQRKQAAAFMIDLTEGVDAFLDKLGKHGRARAAEIRGNLASCARDRRDGMAIWRGNFHKSRPAKEQPSHAALSMVAESPAAPASQAEPEAPVVAQEATAEAVNTQTLPDKVKVTHFATGRQPARNPQGRHGAHPK